MTALYAYLVFISSRVSLSVKDADNLTMKSFVHTKHRLRAGCQAAVDDLVKVILYTDWQTFECFQNHLNI